MSITNDTLSKWASESSTTVALHLQQRLTPVEGDGAVIFPPTYADIGYNIDTLSDGTRVATIDSVGSQSNRIEPLFKSGELAKLIPKIEIELPGDAGSISILDLAHRAADAVVQASPGLNQKVADAFKKLRGGNAAPLCRLAPTSLVFGVWDSRGETSEKRPRLLRSIVRAWDVEPIHAAAQFNSIWKRLDAKTQEELEGVLKKTAPKGDDSAREGKSKLSEVGLKDAPATFRKVDKIPQYRDGAPNPEARVLGGIVVRGKIVRDVTVNLVALRGLRGENDNTHRDLREYLLGLTLLAATRDMDLYLREGCHLRYAGDERWREVPRRGELVEVDLTSEGSYKTLIEFTEAARTRLGPGDDTAAHFKFSVDEAKKLVTAKD